MKNTTKLTMMIMGVKCLLLLLIIAKPVYVNAQASASIKPVNNEKSEIAKSINLFFEGFGKGDTNMIKGVTWKTISLKTIVDYPGKPISINEEPWSDFLKLIAKPHKQKFDEQIVSWDIQIDGKYANAWCKYKLFIDSSFHHWGIDNFQLIKYGSRWMILNITDTRRAPETYIEDNEIPSPLKTDQDLVSMIDDLMNKWHKAAATGDEVIFFHSMDSSCVYLGTDKTEHWTKQEFETWSKKYFEKDKAWDFKPYDRHIYFNEDKSYAWFDELLETWMGVSRGSGVLKYENGHYRLMHYNLAVTVPNEKMKKFVKINK